MDFASYRGQLRRHRRAGGLNLVLLSSIDSTNRLGRRIVRELLDESEDVMPVLILALEQTAGRGRGDHRWQSPRGAGIYATLVVPEVSSEQLNELPLRVAVGLVRALGRHCSMPCGLKWPNDLMVDGAKIGGVLIEAIGASDGETAAVVGFGINHAVGVTLPAATSLAASSQEPPGLGAFAWELAEGIGAALAGLGDLAGAVEDYARASVHRPGDRLSCRVGAERVEGVFRGFDPRGFLRLEREGREEVLVSGQVVDGPPPAGPRTEGPERDGR